MPLATLTVSPFSLPQGSSVYARIVAINYYGDSSVSAPGNGALILLVPDAPTSVQNVPSVTNKSQIGLSWLVLNDGGAPILDYSISYD